MNENTDRKSLDTVLIFQFLFDMSYIFQWVDEVVEGAPYVTTVETLDK